MNAGYMDKNEKSHRNTYIIGTREIGGWRDILDNKICVYYISLSSFRLSEVVCEDVSCYALGEKGIYYVSEDDGNVYYKTYQNSESIEKTAIENCSNSLLKYGDNGWLIQEQKSVSDGQIYAFNEVKGVSKILFKSNR